MATPLTKGSVARLPWWRRSDGARSGAEQTRERSDERVFVDVSGADGDIESTADMRGGEDGGDAPSERAAVNWLRSKLLMAGSTISTTRGTR